MSESESEKLRYEAANALVVFFAFVIRNEIGDDPDHSGPEDAADVLVEKTIDNALAELLASDWRDLLE